MPIMFYSSNNNNRKKSYHILTSVSLTDTQIIYHINKNTSTMP